MMKKIGIMGGLVCNENLGCVALTYSLLKLLQEVSKETHIDFCYTIFEFEYDSEKYEKLASFLKIEKERITYAPIGYCYAENWKLMIKKSGINFKMLKKIKKCDVVIDLTQGDSFTDIYGMDRFWRLTAIKEIVTKMKIPLILGPQTYGPFESISAKERAKKVIEKSRLVISRDQKSKDYIKTFTDKTVKVTTDLAFGLPFEKYNSKKNNTIKIGINPSGLLFSNKTENTDLHMNLKTDYDKYIRSIIYTLSADKKFEVHIIPHVGQDAVKEFVDIPAVICHEEFSTPVEAKNCIATMDIFVGSRMHATIGAFSAGVATIPVAYSRKFAGLYNSLGYNHVVELCDLDTEHAINETLNLIKNYKQLTIEVQNCMEGVKKKNDELKSILANELKKIL